MYRYLTKMLAQITHVLLCILTVGLVLAQNQEDAKACRPKYPGYFINEEHEAIYQGCYHSDGIKAVLPKESLINYRTHIDWDAWIEQGYAKDIIERCGKKAIEMGTSYFGVEFYGECYMGNAPDFTQTRVTETDSCHDLCSYGVGGPLVMVVYKVETWAPKCDFANIGYYIDDTHWAWNRGCYQQSPDSFVFPFGIFVNFRYDIDWFDFSNAGHAGSMVKRCGLVALENGAQYFGVENFGSCYYGNEPNIGHGELSCKPAKNQCYWDVGMVKHIAIYKVENM